MARDYKSAARTRPASSSGSAGSLFVGIVIGLLLGLGIALGVAIYLNKVPGPFVQRSKPTEPAPAPGREIPKAAPTVSADARPALADEKPRFDFYNILPGTGDTGAKPGSKPASAPGAAPAARAETFYVQAGAFQKAADADNMKARLALLGVEAAVKTTATLDRGQLHRVRVGPFTRVEDVSRIRDTLKQNGIETTLIKAREAQN